MSEDKHCPDVSGGKLAGDKHCSDTSGEKIPSRHKHHPDTFRDRDRQTREEEKGERSVTLREEMWEEGAALY